MKIVKKLKNYFVMQSQLLLSISFPVVDNTDISVRVEDGLDFGMSRFGFECKDYRCTPCKPGTYGNRSLPGCSKCPAGKSNLKTF